MTAWWKALPGLRLAQDSAELDGLQVALKGSPLTARQRRRLRRGLYETEERRFLQAVLKPGDRVLELGASLGIVTCFIARSVGPTGRVVAVEANADLQRHFERQLHLNGLRADWVHALCCPLWDQPVPPELAGLGFSPSPNSLSGRMSARPSEGRPVSWLTSAEVCERAALEPTALLVDIEGAERVWVDHPPRFPGALRAIVLEIHPRHLGLLETGAVVRAVLAEGFQLIAIEDNVIAFQR